LGEPIVARIVATIIKNINHLITPLTWCSNRASAQNSLRSLGFKQVQKFCEHAANGALLVPARSDGYKLFLSDDSSRSPRILIEVETWILV
jgi:hypothetical protein